MEREREIKKVGQRDKEIERKKKKGESAKEKR